MIVEHSTNLFFLHTPDNQLRYVSPQSLPMIGYRPEEAMRNWTELLTDHPANAIGIQRTEQALRTGQPQPHYELQLRTKSGRLIWVEVREAPVVVNGETVAIAGSLTDITARVAAEAAARASDQRLRSIADHAPFGAHIYTLTADDRLILEGANHPADRILHIDHRTLFGKDIEEAFPGLKGTDIPTTYRRIAREGGPVHFEQVSYDKDQIQGVFDVHALQSGPGRMIVFFSDITEQRRSEAALRASEERFRSLFNAGNDAVFVHRLADRGSGRFTEVNDVACRMLGYTREELGTLGPAGIHAPDAAQILDTAFDRLDRDRHALFESTLVTKSRERLPVEISARVFDFAQVPTVISVVRDIAERKRLEEQLRHSQKMEVFGQLASGVAHDFNNLLVVINGNTEMLLQERGLDAALREPVEQVHEAGTRAAALTRQLLLFSRRQKPQTQQADLAVIVGNLVKLLRRVIGEHINLNLEFAPTPLPVLVDVNMIEQVLMNLAVNARDAMPRGGLLTIRTHTGTLAEPEAARLGCRPGPYAVLRVRDNGSGIPPEIQPKIFDPFFTTKETGKGTGLGLSTVLAILQQHEGGIAFTSEPDKGTEFTAYLPLAGAPSGLADPDAAKAAVAAVGRKATILLVEDEEGVRRTAARVLRVHGLTVEEARSGREALERLPSLAGRIDLVLSDIVMPGGVDGLALAREIARRWPELPVVLMTGYTRDTEQVDRPLLHKPFTIDSLMEAVRSALSSAPGRS
jgi:PAS domain S-box-containing protein